MYCVGCEEAKSEDDVITDGDRKLCKIHLTPVENVKEKNYFFRLSAYADKLLAWYETDPVRPESRLNEVRSFVEGGLRDLSISRTTVKWGLPVPDDPEAHGLRLGRRAHELPHRRWAAPTRSRAATARASSGRRRTT